MCVHAQTLEDAYKEAAANQHHGGVEHGGHRAMHGQGDLCVAVDRSFHGGLQGSRSLRRRRQNLQFQRTLRVADAALSRCFRIGVFGAVQLPGGRTRREITNVSVGRRV